MKRKKWVHPPKLEPQRAKKRCSASGKIKWVSELDAKLAICNRDLAHGSNSVRNGHSHHEVRVYECPDCKFWHTTHIRVHKEKIEPQPTPKRDLAALQRVAQASRRDLLVDEKAQE